MSISTETLNREQTDNLRRRPMGELALKLLSFMCEHDIIANENHYYEIRFWKKSSLEKVNPFSQEENLRLDKAFTALIRRGYVLGTNINYNKQSSLGYSDFNKMLLNLLNQDKREDEKYRPRNDFFTRENQNIAHLREVPWDSHTTSMILSPEGIQAVTDLAQRISRVKKKMEKQKSDPVFIITQKYMDDLEGNRVLGAGGVYRVERKTPGKIWISPTQSEDNAPFFDPNNSCVEEENNYGGVKAMYVLPQSILIETTDMNLVREAIGVTQSYQEYLAKKTKKMEQAIKPIQDQLNLEKAAGLTWLNRNIQELCKQAVELKENSSTLPDRENDEIVLGDEELDFKL